MRRAPPLVGAEVIGRRELVPAVLDLDVAYEAADGLQPGIALRDGTVPATRNLDHLDPAVTLDVAGENRTGSWDAALANSFGFGGHNVSLVLGRAS